MQNRWIILGVLFFGRAMMAFQFQFIAGISPLYMQGHHVGLADLGLIIGLYVAPGIVIAYPGAAIGLRLGDKPAVSLGLALMVAGGALMALVPDWPAQITGRLVSGVGGILINVLMTKLVADRFTGREIATAMGLFVTSWPVGLGLALAVTPLIADLGGLGAAMWSAVLLPFLALALFAMTYRPVTPDPAVAAPAAARLAGRTLVCVLLAGGTWGVYNAALNLVLGFGPAMLVERGWSLAAGSSAVSLCAWTAILSVPLGGVIADRTGRKDLITVVGILGFAAGILLATWTEMVYPAFLLLGLVGGAAGGPLMSLAAEVLGPGNRAAGMGVFFTLHYGLTLAGAVLGGQVSDALGGAGYAMLLGVALLGAALLQLAIFRGLAPRPVPAAG